MFGVLLANIVLVVVMSSGSSVRKVAYRDSIVESLSLCPFDHNQCSHVADCDDVLSLRTGFDCTDGYSCPRAKRKR